MYKEIVEQLNIGQKYDNATGDLLDMSYLMGEAADAINALTFDLAQLKAAPSTSPTELTDQEITDLYFGATGQTLRPADMFLVRVFAHAVEARTKHYKGGA